MGVPALVDFITKAKRAYTTKQLADKFFLSKTTVRKALVRMAQKNQVLIATCGRELTYRANPKYEEIKERIFNEGANAPKRPDHEAMELAIQNPRRTQEGSGLV